MKKLIAIGLLALIGITKTNAQLCGFFEPLKPVTPIQSGNGVLLPIYGSEGTSPGYWNCYYYYNNLGKLVNYTAVLSFAFAGEGYYGYCNGCNVSQFPQLYRAIPQPCVGNPNTSCHSFDSAVGLTTNQYSNSTNWSSNYTWDNWSTPNFQTPQIAINKSIILDVNYTLTSSMSFRNGSILTIPSGITLINSNAFVPAQIGGGKIINNGTYKGTGTRVPFENNGTFSPGVNGVGSYISNTKVSATSNSIFNFEIGAANSFDKIYTTDSVVVNGVLNISFINGYTPVVGHKFVIIEAGKQLGTFSSVNLPSGVTALVEYNVDHNNGTRYVDVTITGVNVPLSISGPSLVCVGGSITLIPNFTGGLFSSLVGNASVNATTGVVTGLHTATSQCIIQYKLGNKLATKTITVNAKPSNAITISLAGGTLNPQNGSGGGSNFCNNKTFTLSASPSGGTWSSTGGVTIGATTGIINTTTLGSASVTYTITNAGGCANSKTLAGTVVACASRGINTTNPQFPIPNSFTLYPNPAKSFISLNVHSLMGSGSVLITDLYGKQIKQQVLNMGANTIDVSRFAKGMYVVSIITEQGKETKKIVIE